MLFENIVPSLGVEGDSNFLSGEFAVQTYDLSVTSHVEVVPVELPFLKKIVPGVVCM